MVRISSNGFDTVINVTSPPYICITCRYTNGAARVNLRVSLPGNPRFFAEVPYTYYTPPTLIWARFLSGGEGLELMFDSSTDMGGQALSAPCSPLFLNMTSFGALTPTCTWPSSSYLIVLFGPSATLVPGDTLTLTANIIKSANLVSLASPSMTVTVLAPAALRPLSLVAIRGPSEIDTCSLYDITVDAVSPRPLIYRWRCLDDADLDGFLVGWRYVFMLFMCVYVCVYVCVCTYIHTHTLTRQNCLIHVNFFILHKHLDCLLCVCSAGVEGLFLKHICMYVCIYI